MSVGRNDPCPCGSGKKYKRCHGAESLTLRPEVARANALKAVDQELSSRLLRFARTPRTRQALEVLLKNIERDESRLPADQRIDLSWLRPELGIE